MSCPFWQRSKYLTVAEAVAADKHIAFIIVANVLVGSDIWICISGCTTSRGLKYCNRSPAATIAPRTPIGNGEIPCRGIAPAIEWRISSRPFRVAVGFS